MPLPKARRISSTLLLALLLAVRCGSPLGQDTGQQHASLTAEPSNEPLRPNATSAPWVDVEAVIGAGGGRLANASDPTARCARYEPLYAQIVRDLSQWDDGISDDLMRRTVRHFGTPPRHNGLHVGFINGRAQLFTESVDWAAMKHHGPLLLTYLRLLLWLEDRAGPYIPDCELVVSTTDR